MGEAPAKFKRWKCILCGDDVIEGQRLVYVPRAGFAHLECVASRIVASGALDAGVASLLDAVEAVSYAIVRLKAAQGVAPEGRVSEELAEARKRVEGVAARLEALLVEELARRGVDLTPGRSESRN